MARNEEKWMDETMDKLSKIIDESNVKQPRGIFICVANEVTRDDDLGMAYSSRMNMGRDQVIQMIQDTLKQTEMSVLDLI